jgi:hypothetical protein
MRSNLSGMVLFTTVVGLSVMTCMWLSLIHALFLFRRVTSDLEQQNTIVKTLEQSVEMFVLHSDARAFESCIHQPCTNRLGVYFSVKKMSCEPCLILDKSSSLQGTQHWFIYGKLGNKQWVVRWATPENCGQCAQKPIFLASRMLSCSQYP